MELSIPCCSALKIAPLSNSGCRLKIPASTAAPSYLHFSNASLKFPSAAIRRRRHFILVCSIRPFIFFSLFSYSKFHLECQCFLNFNFVAWSKCINAYFD